MPDASRDQRIFLGLACGGAVVIFVIVALAAPKRHPSVAISKAASPVPVVVRDRPALPDESVVVEQRDTAGPLPGERILQGYASIDQRPEGDLSAVAHLLSNFALLAKQNAPLPLGSNAEIAAALRGRNRIGLRFLPDRHPTLNERGEIIDRWGHPLFFHAESSDQIEIRSAGPDGVMWTDDDLQRDANGKFTRGFDASR